MLVNSVQNSLSDEGMKRAYTPSMDSFLVGEGRICNRKWIQILNFTPFYPPKTTLHVNFFCQSLPIILLCNV